MRSARRTSSPSWQCIITLTAAGGLATWGGTISVGCSDDDDAVSPPVGGAAAAAGSAGSTSTSGGSGGIGGSSGGGATGGTSAGGGTGGSGGSTVCAPIGSMQFLGDFETGNLDGWSFSGNDTTTVITSPVRAGQYAALMVVGPDDDVPYRSELTAANGAGTFYDGNEYWIGVSFRIEDWGTDLPQWATLFQTHATPHELPEGGFDWNCNAGKNSITVTTSGNEMRLNVVVNPDQSQLPGTAAIATEVWSEPLPIGVWVDWVFRYRPSTGDDGIVVAWRNGEQIFSQMGANRFVLDNCNEPAAAQTYMKVGIYRDQANTSTQRLDYDEVRIFAGTDGYCAVAPE